MYKNEILTNVLKTYLGERTDALETNYSHHTEKLLKSFKILDEMKELSFKVDASINEILTESTRPSLNRSTSRREINKSFVSNTNSKTLLRSKSKVLDKERKNEKSKTPIKRPDKSLGKSIDRQKSGIFKTNEIQNVTIKKIGLTGLTGLNKNLTLNKFNTFIKKEEIDQSKRGVSRTPRNKDDLSPGNRKNLMLSKINTPITRSPDISRNKTALLISKKAEDKKNLKVCKQEGPPLKNVPQLQQYNTHTITNVNMNNFNIPLNTNTSNISSNNLTNNKIHQNVLNTNESLRFKISQNGNISQIIDIDNSMPDESLINNKDDLFITSTLHDHDINFNNSIMNNLMSSINFNTPKTKGIKLEYDEILDDRWSIFEQFFTRYDKIKLLCLNKKYGKYSIASLIENMKFLKQGVYEKIQKFKVYDSSNSANGMNTPHKFSYVDAIPFSKGTNKAIELLNDNLYVKLFTEISVPKHEIMLVYKLFFQLIQHPFVQLFENKNLFWKECCVYFLTNSDGKIGTFIAKKLREVNISPENIYKIWNLLGDNVNKINPNNFSKICGTTGLFVFFIKDAIDYIGLGSKCDRYMNIEKCLWILTNLLQLIEKRLNNLQRIMNQFYNIY